MAKKNEPTETASCRIIAEWDEDFGDKGACENTPLAETSSPKILRTKSAQRDPRMMSIIKQGKIPYVPRVMKWLSEQLGKPKARITQADVENFLK